MTCDNITVPWDMSQKEETQPLLVSNDSPEELTGEMTEDLAESSNSPRTDGETSLIEDPLASIELDKLLVERLGEFGRYQKLVYFMVCLPAALTAGLTLSSVFTEFSPDHRCAVVGCDDVQVDP